MTEGEDKTVETGFIESKFGRTLLTIVTVFLIFAGPTYIVYGLAVLLKVDLAASLLSGAVLFIIGLVMALFLTKKKIIT